MNAQYLLLPALIGLGACVIHDRGGPTEYSSANIDLDSSELVHVNLHMGAGDLRITDGAQKLVRADFAYNVRDWKPEVSYTRGNLTIKQPDTHHTFIGNTRNRWDLQLNNKVPMDFEM